MILPVDRGIIACLCDDSSLKLNSTKAILKLLWTDLSIYRAVVSLVSGRIFSLSLLATAAGLGYPLDYRLVFLMFGTVIYVCVLLTACLPVSINKQKIVEDMPREQL